MYHKLKKCLNSRSSHQRCSIEKAVLKNFAIFTGKHLCQSLLLIDFKTCNFLKKGLRHRCFPVNIAKFLRTFILMKICEQLILPFLLLLIFLLKGLFLLLIQYTFFKDPLQCLKSSPQDALWQVPLLFEKKKTQPKWSLVVIRCHSLSSVVPLVVTRCHSMCYSSVFLGQPGKKVGWGKPVNS